MTIFLTTILVAWFSNAVCTWPRGREWRGVFVVNFKQTPGACSKNLQQVTYNHNINLVAGCRKTKAIRIGSRQVVCELDKAKLVAMDKDQWINIIVIYWNLFMVLYSTGNYSYTFMTVSSEVKIQPCIHTYIYIYIYFCFVPRIWLHR